MISGIDHVALITADMEATVRFYRDILGLPLTLEAVGETLKHYNFRCGESTLAFFQYLAKENPPAPRRPESPGPHAPHGTDHIALRVLQRNEFDAMVLRLEKNGVTMRGPVDHGSALSMYFTDNNGIALELTMPKE